jgi:hypothetical protein
MDWTSLTADMSATDAQETAHTSQGGWSFGDILTKGIPSVIDAAGRYQVATGTGQNVYAAGPNGQTYTAPGGMPNAAAPTPGANLLQGNGLLILGGLGLVLVLVVAMKKG